MAKRFHHLTNPFPLVGYNGPRYFCDREKELDILSTSVKNGQNISLIARRRLGKSALLSHLQHVLEPQWKVISIDLIKTSSLQQLYQQLAQALFEKRSSGIFSKFKDIEILSRLRMTLGINPITQLPEISFDLKENQLKQSLTALLDWLATEKHTVLIFDEFQQILTYDQPETEGFLRSEMMRLPGVRFIFCGSDQHVLEDMFHQPSRPFFNSTTNMGLDSIAPEIYKKFIAHHFEKTERNISAEALDFVLHVAGGETYAVQKICNAIFAGGSPHITLPIAKDIFRQVLLEQQSYGERIRALLRADSVQFSVLSGIARSGSVVEITGKEFLEAYGLYNSSSVLKAVKALEGYQLISRKIEDGKMAWYVNDALLKAWLNTLPH